MGRIGMIDLGEVPAAQVSEDPPVRPWPHRRWTLVALVAGLALVTVGGSRPAVRPLPMAVLDLPGVASAQAAGDRLFVVDPSPARSRVGDRSVAAYRLMDLKPLWRADLPVAGELTGFTVAGDTLMVTSEPDMAVVQRDGQVVEKPPDTVGLDAATGRTRWRSEGYVEGLTPGGRPVVWIRAVTAGGGVPAGEQPREESLTLRVLAADTGDVRWSYDLPAGGLLANRYDGRRVTLLGLLLATGRVELRDPDTGRILRSGQIDGSAGTGGTDRYAEIVGDLLMTRMGSRLTAYDLDRLDRRWTINLQPGQDGWVAGCGRLLCLHGQSWQGISVLDPQTGRVKWSDPRWSDLLTVGEHLVAMEPDPQQDTRRLTVIDPETGHGRRDLGEWQALDWNQSAGSAIGVRFEFTRAVVARLDPERGPQVLGVLHGVSRVCWVNAPTLLCRRSDNRLGVWRLPD